MKYLKTADDTFREHLIMQQHSETKENYGLKKHGKEVATKIIPFENIALVIKSWSTRNTWTKIEF
jgi:hypothetical protein